MKVFVLGTGGWGIALAMLRTRTDTKQPRGPICRRRIRCTASAATRSRCRIVVIPRVLRLRPTCPARQSGIWSLVVPSFVV